MTLELFKEWFLQDSHIDCLETIEVRNSGDRMSLVMFRDPPFQAELVVWGPNLILPAHRHPHMDSYQVHVSGFLTVLKGPDEAACNALLERAKIWAPERIRARGDIRIRPTDWHAGKAGPKGASFWSIQKWDGAITAAGIDWESEAVLVKPAMICS